MPKINIYYTQKKYWEEMHHNNNRGPSLRKYLLSAYNMPGTVKGKNGPK